MPWASFHLSYCNNSSSEDSLLQSPKYDKGRGLFISAFVILPFYQCELVSTPQTLAFEPYLCEMQRSTACRWTLKSSFLKNRDYSCFSIDL